MNELAIGQENTVVISLDTKELIKAGVAENTLNAYRRALKDLDSWRQGGDNGFRIEQNGDGADGLNDAGTGRSTSRNSTSRANRRQQSRKRSPRSSGKPRTSIARMW